MKLTVLASRLEAWEIIFSNGLHCDFTLVLFGSLGGGWVTVEEWSAFTVSAFGGSEEVDGAGLGGGCDGLRGGGG